MSRARYCQTILSLLVLVFFSAGSARAQNAVVLENQLRRPTHRASGTLGAPATPASRASPRRSASTRASRSTSRSDTDATELSPRQDHRSGPGRRRPAPRRHRALEHRRHCPRLSRPVPATPATGCWIAVRGRFPPRGPCPSTRPRASTWPSLSARIPRTAGPVTSPYRRDDDGGSDLLFQTSDTTWQAYNRYGGGPATSGTRR